MFVGVGLNSLPAVHKWFLQSGSVMLLSNKVLDFLDCKVRSSTVFNTGLVLSIQNTAEPLWLMSKLMAAIKQIKPKKELSVKILTLIFKRLNHSISQEPGAL